MSVLPGMVRSIQSARVLVGPAVTGASTRMAVEAPWMRVKAVWDQV